MSKFQLIKFTLSFFILLTVLYLLFGELTYFYNQLRYALNNFDLKYLIIAIFFSIVSLLFNSYSLLILYRVNIKISFFQWCRYIYNSYVFDHIPFVGTVYRARKLKKKKGLNYNDFLALHVFAILLNFFLIFILLRFFLLNEDFNIFNIDLKLLNLIIVLYFTFLLFIYYLKKLKYLLLKLSNNYIYQKLLNTVLIFFLTQSYLLKNKLLILKYTILIMFTHLFSFIFFFFIFKTFSFTLDLSVQILIYLIFSISTLIKIFPKNYVINEYIGASLIAKTSIGFTGGLIFFILYRFLNLVSILLLFFYFNIASVKIKKKFI
jgi:hypothetical protein